MRRAARTRRLEAGLGESADQQPLGRRPRPVNPVGGLPDAHVRVDALGRLAEGQLAQRDEVPLAEEVLGGALCLRGEVDLPFAEALEQIVGRDVHEVDLGRLLHDRVGHRLADDDARDLRDHVVEALDVLHVERRVDVDPRVEELLHVLPPFRVAAALGVRVGELVDEEDLRVPLERRVEVELLDGDAPVLDPLAGQDSAGRGAAPRCRSGRGSRSTPTTTSRFSCSSSALAASSMAYVFPTPGAAPKKTFSLPRRAWRSSSVTCRRSSSGLGLSWVIRLSLRASHRRGPSRGGYRGRLRNW